MLKKSSALLIMLAIIISMCTGCTKYYYEKEEAEDMAELGKDIVSEYLEENDIDATIVSCEATIYGVPVRYLTAYANGIIEEDGTTYEFYVDTETEQIYTGKYSEELSAAIESRFYDFIELEEQDIISIKTANYELILPNKWGNENVPNGDVRIGACVLPIEVTDVEEYLESDNALMINVTFDASVEDYVDLSFLKDTNYLDEFGNVNIVPNSISISNRLFKGYVCVTHMFYSEFELVDFEEFQMAIMTHHFSKYGDEAEDFTYETDDVDIDIEGDSYYFNLRQRYDHEYENTHINLYFIGDNPPALSYSFTRDNKDVTGDCVWNEYDDGIWRLSADRVLIREEFVITRK